ncbi:SAM hydrolase/SAM-dependent halogenase family protein [Frigoriflavimonas asaccharolytica]|uniref:SAM-dependent chlorinase/fluorinase n=1 Tax=Frigoriflavimonas asaccharolytica TaxID=2735899 RepID=A0A8J8G796_9FLAO|nr:SAM-dependent chlorinase/fluorinase [Frigoriflavimonas asaccharolytica]NRS91985.1 hypothetical protein [Frigoriflavimonas asaccharolytica]
MPIITLTSDFGNKDFRVPAMKGKILSLNIGGRLIDISHEIDAYNLIEASYIVRNTYKSFPKGSIHIIAVDSFYNKNRKCILYEADGHYFLAADNGLLSLIFFDIIPTNIFEITFKNRFEQDDKFTTIDLFAETAAHLQKGGLPEIIGRKLSNPKELSFPRPTFSSGKIVGEFMYIDHFGNVVSNISKTIFTKKMVNYDSFSIQFRNQALTKIYNTRTGVVADWDNEKEYLGKAAAIFNEFDLLELTIYKGNINNGAKTLFGLNIGDKIFIQFSNNL